MTAPPSPDVPARIARAEARRLYCESTMPVAAIAARMGVSCRAFQANRARWGWPARYPERGRRRGADEVPSLAALLREQRALLAQLIADANAPEVTPPERERLARAIAQVTRGVAYGERLARLELEQAGRGGESHDDAGSGRPIADLRAELARRIERLVAQRLAAPEERPEAP